MFFVYIDDSGDERVRCYSALVVHESKWKECHALIRAHRRALKVSDKMFVTKELHATEFVAGRGKIGADVVTKARRGEIYRETLQMIAGLPKVRMFNAICAKNKEKVLFEYLINRINRTMAEWKSHAVIVHDEGKDFTSLVRRMGVYNPIKSRLGCWSDGKEYRNFPTDRILEDIFFRKSHKSDFIQMADLCAYALFRNEHPLPSKAKYGINTAFECLYPICIRAANGKDVRKLGIIRA